MVDSRSTRGIVLILVIFNLFVIVVSTVPSVSWLLWLLCLLLFVFVFLFVLFLLLFIFAINAPECCHTSDATVVAVTQSDGNAKQRNGDHDCVDDCKTCLFYQSKDEIIDALNTIKNLNTSQEADKVNHNLLMNEVCNIILKHENNKKNALESQKLLLRKEILHLRNHKRTMKKQNKDCKKELALKIEQLNKDNEKKIDSLRLENKKQIHSLNKNIDELKLENFKLKNKKRTQKVEIKNLKIQLELMRDKFNDVTNEKNTKQVELKNLKTQLKSMTNKFNHVTNEYNREMIDYEELQRETTCVICVTGKRNRLFYPCSHLVCCQDCCKQIFNNNTILKAAKCPICRTPITTVVNVYS